MTMPETTQPEQWPVQSQQPMHWDYSNKITPMVCAADVEQISIPLANNAENEITEIMTCSKSTTN